MFESPDSGGLELMEEVEPQWMDAVKVKEFFVEDSESCSRVERTLKPLFKELQRILGQDPQTLDCQKYLDATNEELKGIVVKYPRWKFPQVFIAFNRVLEEYTPLFFCSYEDGMRVGISRQDVRVSRREYRPLYTEGVYYLKYKGIPLRIRVEVLYTQIIFKVEGKYLETLETFVKEFKERIEKYNPFKGEKVLVSKEGTVLDFLDYTPLTWSDIIIDEEEREMIEVNLLYPLKKGVLLAKHGIPWKRGVLLVGAPGVGKTLLSKVICSQVKSTVLWVTVEAIEGSSSIRRIFEIARELAPTLIIFEDIDIIGLDRDNFDGDEIGELLTQLDGIQSNVGVFVLATTNRPELLDKALLNRPSRFDVVYEVGLPKEKERREMIKLFLGPVKMQCPIEDLVTLTKGLTGAQIKEVVNYAKLLSLYNGKESLSMEELDKALRKVRGKKEKYGYLS